MRLACTAGLLLLAALPAAAQTGRAGSTWQTEMDLEREQQAAFLAENERLSADEWREAALTTIRFDLEEGSLVLRDLRRVADAKADKKAKVEKTGGAPERDSEDAEIEDYFDLDIGGGGQAEEEVWTVRFGKKPPRTLTLTLTDKDATQVKCSVQELEAVGSGVIGIFQNEYLLLCVPRDLDSA